MDEREIAIWSNLSPPGAVEIVTQAGREARDYWYAHIDDPVELRVLEVINRRDFYELTRRQAGEAAANAAIEAAIIVDVWPASVDQVFRR